MERKTSAVVEVVNFCLDHAESAPLPRRISLYRGLAVICTDEHESAIFKQLADDLEAADQRCREFAFRFKNGGLR